MVVGYKYGASCSWRRENKGVGRCAEVFTCRRVGGDYSDVYQCRCPHGSGWDGKACLHGGKEPGKLYYNISLLNNLFREKMTFFLYSFFATFNFIPHLKNLFIIHIYEE